MLNGRRPFCAYALAQSRKASQSMVLPFVIDVIVSYVAADIVHGIAAVHCFLASRVRLGKRRLCPPLRAVIAVWRCALAKDDGVGYNSRVAVRIGGSNGDRISHQIDTGVPLIGQDKTRHLVGVLCRHGHDFDQITARVNYRHIGRCGKGGILWRGRHGMRNLESPIRAAIERLPSAGSCICPCQKTPFLCARRHIFQHPPLP